MKILGGKYRGRNFYMPAWIRPTQNITRKAVFDLIGNDLTGLEFLELFAGSGAVGLEALSHEAKKVVFVERDHRCVEVIQENLGLLGMKNEGPEPPSFEILNTDAFVAIKELFRQGRRFDIVFLDPPYAEDVLKKVLKTFSSYDIFNPCSFLFVEHGKRENLPEKVGRFSLIKHRKYGISFLGFYQSTGTPDESPGIINPEAQ